MSQDVLSSPGGRSFKEHELERLLAFSLADEEYAVPLLDVKEVIALPEITTVPYTPDHFKGIMNLRGQIISIIDLRLKFSLRKKNAGSETAVVILDLDPLSLGIVVDSVNSVVSVSPGELSPPPDLESTQASEWITGVVRRENRLILLLDIEKTLNTDELRLLHAQLGKKSA